MLWFFGAYTYHQQATKPQKIPGHGQLKVVLPLLKMAVHVLQDWPLNFQQFLLDYTQPASGQSASLKIYLGEMHQALRQLLQHPELHFLHEEFEHFVHERWKDVLVRSELFHAAHPLISGANAAKFLGITLRQLKKLIDESFVSGRYVTSRNGRTRMMVERASVELFCEQSGPLITLHEAAQLLQVSISRLRLLIEHKFLCATTVEKTSSNSRHMRLSQKAIYAFLTSLDHNHTHPYSAADSLIAIYKIWRYGLKGDNAFLALIEALRSKELEVVGSDPALSGLRALLVNRQAFKQWHQRYYTSQDLMTIPEAARALHMDEDMLYRLCKQKLVPTQQLGRYSGTRAALGIAAADIGKIRQRYVWGMELAKQLGLPHQTAGQHLLQAGVVPVCKPEPGMAGGYVFTRETVVSFLPSIFME
ncbi:hypothetical protein [Chromobacterium piscinae]|uniref:hypothetical protein n=1 Tax=Chromobacterium piscinae TaxID=686831 RepID=UPI003F8185B2